MKAKIGHFKCRVLNTCLLFLIKKKTNNRHRIKMNEDLIHKPSRVKEISIIIIYYIEKHLFG